MGIPSFFSHLVKEHPRCIKEILENGVIDNLYLDSNSIIYDCVRKSSYHDTYDDSFEKQLMKDILDKINEYISCLKPMKRCIVAFDGVPPVAKLNQQRSRRYKSMIDGMVDTHLSGTETKTWNTSAITPGTHFMNKLMQYLDTEFKKGKFHNVITMYGSNEPGEGEHKIFDFIRNNESAEFSQETHVIYGLDADLIMLTLNHLYVSKNMTLFRETPHFISKIDSSLHPDKLYCLDIPEFSKSIAHEMGKYRDVDKSNQLVINDYIFLCFILGNDFMPHFPSINIRTNGIDILLETYKKVIGSSKYFLTKNECINWNQVRRLVEELKRNEISYLQHEQKKRSHYESRELPTKSLEEKKYKYLLLPTKRRETEKFINPGSRGWESRYYSSLCDMENTEENVRKISINYIEALEWTLHYYVRGCKDWRWSYKFSYPPLIQDLCKFLPCFNTTFLQTMKADPIQTTTQLGYVLPKVSLWLLGDDTKNKLLEEFPEQYRDDYPQKWSYCKYIWESHVCLPYFDLDSLEKKLAV